MNQINLIGRLTKDADAKTTNTGKQVVNFTLAVDDGKNAEGQKQTLFVNCQAWGKTGEVIAQYTSKGSQLQVTGKLSIRNYEKDGVKKYITEVVVFSCELLGKPKDKENLEQIFDVELEDISIDMDKINTNLPF
jgi:single-strand DNA-binding protein